MFWNNRRRAIKDTFTPQIKVFLSYASFQNTGLLLSKKLFKKYDTERNIHQRLLTYMYYDILASSLIGSETQEEIDCVGFLRDTALSYLDDTDSPQFRTYHADNIKDVSKLDKAPLEVLQLLDQNEDFTRSAVAKIGTLAKDFLTGLDQKDMKPLSDQLKHLVEDEGLLRLFETGSEGHFIKNNPSTTIKDNTTSRPPGPWETEGVKQSNEEEDKRTYLLEQTLGQQIKHVTALSKTIDDAYAVRFQVLVFYYCSFLLAAFLKIDDPEVVQVKARAYVAKLTGMQPITIEVFNAYIRENPVFAGTANEFIKISVNNIFSDDFSGNEIPNHLVGIVEQLIFANSDDLLISCQYCGNEWKFQNVNVLPETTLYCMDNYLTNEETGLQVNACLCFKCRRVTEFAADPLNESGMAENGIEYFKTKPLTAQLLLGFHQNAEKHGNEVAIAKMDKLVQNQP